MIHRNTFIIAWLITVFALLLGFSIYHELQPEPITSVRYISFIEGYDLMCKMPYAK